MNRCPRHNQCQHRAKLRVDRQGRCVDCGTQLTDRTAHHHVSAKRGRVVTAMQEYGKPVLA